MTVNTNGAPGPQRFIVTQVDAVFAGGIRVPFRFGRNSVKLTVLGMQTPIEPAPSKDEGSQEIIFTFRSFGSVEMSDENGKRTFTPREGTTMKVRAAKVMIVD